MYRYPVLVSCLTLSLIVPYNGFAVTAKSQSVINNGTNVAAAEKNTVVDTVCQDKFFGCMDTFCMQDNLSGGRCQCSNKVFALDKRLANIDEITIKTQQLSTGADTAIKTANITKSNVNLSLWEQTESDEYDDSDTSSDNVELGDALLISATELCLTRIPECEEKSKMMQLLYSQQIKSDCTAYENSIKSAENDANGKLASVQADMRNAAYTQLKSENKYSLGECVTEFKKCLQTTAGCGTDFAKCTALSTFDTDETYTISGATSGIDITMSTYNILDAKRPICESVLSQCKSVSDNVWDTFLTSNAPLIKNAELIAENNKRNDCIGNIADCFHNACLDKFDPNDTDGSYDVCLTRPDAMLAFCQSELDACGVDTSDTESASESHVWKYVLAKLASMRVDSCTTAVRECLTSPDRCGDDYSQCVGIDTNAIIRMCPYDKLIGCQKLYGDDEIRGDEIYDELSTMVTGLMVNIDNGLLTTCQNALNESMLRICGSTTDCNAAIVDDNLGATSLEYKLCEYAPPQFSKATTFNNCHTSVFDISDEELGRVVENPTVDHIAPFQAHIDGVIYWDSVILDDNGVLPSVTTYLTNIGAPDATATEREAIKKTLESIKSEIDSIVSQVESDPTVQYCMTGRHTPGITPENQITDARFPNYTQNTRMIIGNHIISKARDNYNKRYTAMTEQMLQDYQDMTERQLAIKEANLQDALRESARQACVSFASMANLPRSPRKGKANYTDSKFTETTGYYYVHDFSYQETVNTEFNPDTLTCKTCVKEQQCLKARHPIFGKKNCTNWGTPTETCREIKF